MTDESDNHELLEELAPFLAAVREERDEKINPSDELAERILSERIASGLPGETDSEDLPRTFGPYELRRVLGRGGSGTVYAGFDSELQREVAIKILAAPLAAIPASRERFLREAQAGAQLQHDRIMPIFAVHQDTAPPSFTMPLLEGTTLQSMLDLEGPVASEEVVRIGRDLAEALVVAHRSGFIHRDVKPSNVFIEAGTGRSRLMDFGLVKAEDAPGLTQPGMLAGTPEYLPPEQLDDVEPDCRSDLYGLGATMYAMVAGRPPFSGSLGSVLKKVASEEPAPLASEVPGALREVIEKLTAKRPADRFQSAEELLAALESGTEPMVTTATERRSPWLGAGLLGGLLAAVVGGAILWPRSPDPANSDSSPLPTEGTGLSGILASLPSGETHLIAEPGIYEMSPLDLGDRDLTIEAAQGGTILSWGEMEALAIKSTGTLVFRNLTLQQRVFRREEKTPTLIEFGGVELRFESCRLEQVSELHRIRALGTLIEASSSARIVVQHSEVELLSSAFLISNHANVELHVERSAGFVPQIMIAREGGKVRIRESAIAAQNLLKIDETEEAVEAEVERSFLQSRYAMLWLPGVTEGAGVSRRLTWNGRGNHYNTTWIYLLTNSRSPGGVAPPGIFPPGFHWGGFSDWMAHWGSAEQDAVEAQEPVLQRGSQIQDGLREVFSKGVGPDPDAIGPFWQGSE